MTQEALERGDWQEVIDAHRLESHDPSEWLRYGSALLSTIQPGTEASKQQQQAALAFVKTQKVGPGAGAVAAAQRQVVMSSMRQALELAGVFATLAPKSPAARWRMLGMQRSGTSALAGSLCKQGFDAPQPLAGIPTTAPASDLVAIVIRPDLNHQQPSSAGLTAEGESQTQMDWANRVYRAMHEQGSRQVALKFFWGPEAGGGVSETPSQRRSVMVKCDRSKVVLELPASTEHLLGLKLAKEQAMVPLLALQIRISTVTLIRKWPAAQLCPDQEQALPVRGVNPYTMALPVGVVLAATADPGVVIKIPDDALKHREEELEMEPETSWQPLPAVVANLAIESKSASATSTKAHLAHAREIHFKPESLINPAINALPELLVQTASSQQKNSS